MPTVTSLTTTYAGELAGEILSPALIGFASAANVTVKQNVPYKTVVRKLVDSVSFAAGTCDFTPTGTITLTERILTLEEFQVHRQICKKDFFTDWSTRDVMSGRFNAEIQAAILERMTSGIAAKMETVLWQGINGTTGEFDGLGTLIDADADNDINFVSTPVALTKDNIVSKIDALITACPIGVKAATEKPIIYMNQATWELYMQAQMAAGNGWYLTGGPAVNKTYMGLYEIAVCPGIANNTMYMTQKSNLWFGTWLESDMNSVQILDMENLDASQNVRFSARFYAGAQLGVTSDIAAYGPGLS